MPKMELQLTSGDSLRLRRRLLVRGVVQGVGFRPYVYNLARESGLAGFVKNTSSGVLVEIEGDIEAVDSFEQSLARNGPPLMRIDSIESANLCLANDGAFTIRASESSENVLPCVPADVAVCQACAAETNDPANRRYGYPFTNCTNCGPRYSIIRELPYDRAQTTMAEFSMCAACRSEYENPANRRFHAQPNACELCGPALRLTDSCGKPVPVHDTDAILNTVANLLQSGGIVAWKGLGGYQLICDAHNDVVVQELRRRKHRNGKAFAVMVRDLATAERLCEASNDERVLLTGIQRPIVLLRKKESSKVAPGVAPDSSLLGVMLPCTPMHDLLFRSFDEKFGPGSVLVVTSGNLNEEPICIDETEAHDRLKSVADVFVEHNRPIHTRVDDSVARIMEGREILIRRARGYAPGSFRLSPSGFQLLACGAQQKSTLCLAKDGFAILSQHLGDLENYETFTFFEQTLARMKRLFNIEPEAVVHDLHPGYLSTQFAQNVSIPAKLGIQHHHAHIASCMAEHQLTDSVLGVAFDGTGFGVEQTIWGGEFLIADLVEFERFAHLRTTSIAGGDAAVRAPWRAARAYLFDAFDRNIPPSLSWHNSIPEASVRMLDTLLTGNLQTFQTSSCGRLFDAVASLLNLRQVVSFEGQAAMALEEIADSAEGFYDFAIEGRGSCQVDMRPMIRQIINDVERKVTAGTIAARFHNTLIAVIVDVCVRMRMETDLARVCLSGGCFQNARLLEGSVRALRSCGFEVFFPQQVPCNDGGISLGQAAIATERLRRGV